MIHSVSDSVWFIVICLGTPWTHACKLFHIMTHNRLQNKIFSWVIKKYLVLCILVIFASWLPSSIEPLVTLPVDLMHKGQQRSQPEHTVERKLDLAMSWVSTTLMRTHHNANKGQETTQWFGIWNETCYHMPRQYVIEITSALFNTLSPRRNGPHLPDEISKCIFSNQNIRISTEISLKFVPKVPKDSIPSRVR